MKKIIILLILTQFLMGSIKPISWTINLFTTDSMKKVDYYVKNNVKNQKYDIYVFKEKNKYIVTYGVFSDYLKSESFLNKERRNIQLNNPYVLKYKYNLYKPTFVPTLIKIIRISGDVNYKDQMISNRKKDIKLTEHTKESKIKKREVIKKESKKIIYKHNYSYEVSLSYVSSTLSGNIKLSPTDTTINYKNDLGLTNDYISYVPKIVLSNDRHKLIFSYFTNTYNNTKTLNRDITWDGYTVSKDSNVTSSFDSTIMNFGYAFDIDSYEVGIELNTIKNSVNMSTYSKSVSLDSSHSTIALTLGKQYLLDNSFFSYKVAIGENSYMNYNLALGYKITDHFNMSIGYDVKNINIDNASYESKTDFTSMYIKLIKSF